MKSTHLHQVKPLKISRFWLLTIAASLITVQHTLYLRGEQYTHQALSLVFCLAAASIFWDKRQQLKWGSNINSVRLGTIIIAAIFSISIAYPDVKFLNFTPFLSALGLALLASGIQGLKQYRQELIILFTFGLPQILLPLLPDISPLTAKFSSLLLWYSGFDVYFIGTNISLPNGGVDVNPACSGLDFICYMLGVSVIFIVMFPTQFIHQIIAPIVAAALGFIVNGVRIALLAFLTTQSSEEAFNYWHRQEGGLIFSAIAVLLFTGFYFVLIRQSVPEHQGVEEVKPDPPVSAP